MTQTRTDLHAAIELRYPDNTTSYITPQLLREGLHEMVDSAFVLATDQLPVPPPTAQLLRIDLASGQLLVLLSPDAPTTLASYVLASATAGPVALPAGTAQAGYELRLPASAAGQTLCWLDAAGLPVPLCELSYTDAKIDALLATKQPVAPVVAVVNGVETPFTTLAAAIDAGASVIRLYASAEVSTVTAAKFSGRLFGNGHTITVVNGGRLRLSRYASLYNCVITSTGTGSVSFFGSGNPGSGTVPPPAECVQLFDCQVSAPLTFGNASAYQGLALRGNSVAENVAAGGGPIYLFDLAEVSQPLPAGFTVYNQRAAGYTDMQARAAQLTRAAPTGSTIYLDSAERADDYGTAANGKFTIDATNCQRGVRVRFAVGVGAAKPDFINVPTNRPLKYVPADIYVAGTEFSYSVEVCVDKIEVAIYS